jgi:hypothetical protein
MPFAVYCLVIGRIQRRQYPTFVSGVRDCGGLVLAFSGVLFYLAPGLLTDFNFVPRYVWLYNRYSSLRIAPIADGQNGWQIWWFSLAAGYVLFVVGSLAVLFWKRRKATAIYNAPSDDFELILERALDQCGLKWARHGAQYEIKSHADSDYPGILLEVECWKLMDYVTLHWSANRHPIRTGVELTLQRKLRSATYESMAGNGGMMISAAALFVFLFIIAVLFQIARYLEAQI